MAQTRAVNNNVIIKVNTSLLMSFIILALPHALSNSEPPENRNVLTNPSALALLWVLNASLLFHHSRTLERENCHPKAIEGTMKIISAIYSAIAAANALPPSMYTRLAHITPIAIPPSAATVICAALYGATIPALFYQCLREC